MPRIASINGCGMCMDAHAHELVKAGVSKNGIQSTMRLPTFINAAAQAEFIDNMHKEIAQRAA